jgi:hypothetical protein
MDLTKKLIAGTFTLASLFGCSTINERNFPEGHISGVEYSNLNQKTVPYKLEDQVIYETRYYLQEAKETEENLPMLFYPWNTTQRELDLDSKIVKLNSSEMYLPERVIDEKGKKDKWVDRIMLRNNGIYGIKTYMTSEKELKKRKESENNIGYNFITTEEDAVFGIPTMEILGKEYFVTLVEDNKINEKEKLPFYITPVDGAKILIDNICGNITIYNENRIYRPALIKDANELNRSQTQSVGTSAN